ncbi:hypothetical protein DGG96_08420 [Legionella qingyii]|uniref:Uncharacterized protein n=1 Tax=Legionella qingyii TaxID=2184757 RepID=A0A317U5T1_9GAMM|nr:hypothetical protein DGG96_08420 [Legionella qingyii]
MGRVRLEICIIFLGAVTVLSATIDFRSRAVTTSVIDKVVKIYGPVNLARCFEGMRGLILVDRQRASSSVSGLEANLIWANPMPTPDISGFSGHIPVVLFG